MLAASLNAFFWASPIYGSADGVTLSQNFTFCKGVKSAAKQQIGETRKKCNSDDRRQWRKQGGAVGAAASRMRAAAKQTLGAATRAVSPKVTERANPARKSRCAAMVRFPFVQPLSLASLDSSPSRGASGETVHFAGTAKASPTRGGGTKCRRGCTKDSLTMDEKLNFLRSRLAKKRSSE